MRDWWAIDPLPIPPGRAARFGGVLALAVTRDAAGARGAGAVVMSTLSGPAFEEPDYIPPQARVPFVPVVEPSTVAPMVPWMRNDPAGRWCVVYRYVADSPLYRKTHRASSPADLVRWMRDFIQGNRFLIVCKVFEDVRR